MLLTLRALLISALALVTLILVSLGLPPLLEEAPTAYTPETPQATMSPATEAPSDVRAVDDAVPGASGLDDRAEYQKTLQGALDALTKAAIPEEPRPAALNEAVRPAVVNIICMSIRSGPLNPISASGVIVDPRGIILTNAHVAQYFLLKDYPAKDSLECVIRTGSPARPEYTAALLFIASSWISENASKITESEPAGTGEHDYALLVMTGVTGPSVVPPDAFPYLPIAIAPPDTGDRALIVAYPAGFLGGITIQKELYKSSAEAVVGDRYTFGENHVDLFSVGGTILSQQGSSGGAVADSKGNLIGIVTTATDAPDTASRDLRALSTAYIIRNFQEEAGVTLESLFSSDILARAAAFDRTAAPAFTAALIAAIER